MPFVYRVPRRNPLPVSLKYFFALPPRSGLLRRVATRQAPSLPDAPTAAYTLPIANLASGALFNLDRNGNAVRFVAEPDESEHHHYFKASDCFSSHFLKSIEQMQECNQFLLPTNSVAGRVNAEVMAE
jgi:hypothetical protein